MKKATLAVPVDAVLDSGVKQTFFVEWGAGVFDPEPFWNNEEE
jgi:hypothetical protein